MLHGLNKAGDPAKLGGGGFGVDPFRLLEIVVNGRGGPPPLAGEVLEQMSDRWIRSWIVLAASRVSCSPENVSVAALSHRWTVGDTPSFGIGGVVPWKD